MQRLRQFALATVFLAALASAAQAQQGVRWQSDLPAAQQEAARTGRLVLVHFWTPTCPPCLRLDRDVFVRPQVAQAIEAKYVPVKVNASRHPETAERFGVQSWPTDVILQPNGQVVAKFNSPAGANSYLARMNQVATAVRVQSPSQAAGAGAATSLAGQSNPYAAVAQAAAQQNTSPTAADRYAAGRYAAGQPGTQAAVNINPGVPPAQNPYTAPQPGRYAAPVPNRNIPPAHNPYTVQAGTSGDRYGQTGASPDRYSPAAGAPPNVPGMPAFSGSDPNRYQSAPQAPTVGTSQPRYGAAGSAAQHQGNQYPARQNPGNVSQTQNPYAAQPPAAPRGVAPNPAVIQNRYAAPGTTPANPGMPAVPPAASPHVQANPHVIPPAPVTPPRPAAAPPAEASSQIPAMGLEGYCPVSLVEGQKWVEGDKRWGAIHRGQTYLFVGPEEQKRFLADPDLYSPVLAGNDPVAALEASRMVTGQRRHGVYYRDRIYLFNSEASLSRFSQDPERYATGVRQAMQRAANGPVRR